MVVQREIRGYTSLCSLLVHLEADESLRYGIPTHEALPSVCVTRSQACCHFDSRPALAEVAIVLEEVQLGAVEKRELANSLFEEAIYHDTPNLLQQELRGSL